MTEQVVVEAQVSTPPAATEQVVVDAQTVRDATEARLQAAAAGEQAQEAAWDAEAARAALDGVHERMRHLEERQDDNEAVTMGVIAYLAEEEQAPEAAPEPEHTEVEPRPESKPEDRAPQPDAEQGERHCGVLW